MLLHELFACNCFVLLSLFTANSGCESFHVVSTSQNGWLSDFTYSCTFASIIVSGSRFNLHYFADNISLQSLTSRKSKKELLFPRNLIAISM